MSRPKAISTGTLTAWGIPADCYVLSDGSRVLSQRGIVKALTKTAGNAGRETGNLKVYIDRLPQRFAGLSTGATVEFNVPSGGVATGRDAQWFVDVLKAYKSAWRAGELHPAQVKLAMAADEMLDALAGVGIAALIDEATGHQANRAANALSQLFDRIFRKEPAPWESYFTESLVRAICKLYEYPWDGGAHPRFLASVNRKLYELIVSAPGYEELKRRNPTPQYGSNHSQHLSSEAQRYLRESLAIAELLADQSRDDEDWWRRLNRHFRREFLQLDLTSSSAPPS